MHGSSSAGLDLAEFGIQYSISLISLSLFFFFFQMSLEGMFYVIKHNLSLPFQNTAKRHVLEEIKCLGKTYVVLVFHSLLVFRIFLFIFLYISHGTYGTVMKCKHKLDHIKYVVKRIKVGYHDIKVILRY
jgi:hypothetical protein